MMPHGDLLARRLGVHVADRHAHVGGHLAEHTVRRGERVIRRQVHVDPPEQPEDADIHPRIGGHAGKRPARGARAEVCRADNVLGRLQRRNNIDALVNVVAEGHDIHAIGAHFVEQVRRDPRSAGDILRVGHDQIDAVVFDEIGQLLRDDLPARPADDVAKNENAQGHTGEYSSMLGAETGVHEVGQRPVSISACLAAIRSGILIERTATVARPCGVSPIKTGPSYRK